MERFVLFIEQLEQATALLDSGRPALQRMALVALDNLAEVLLTDYAVSEFLTSDESPLFTGRGYTAAQRDKIMNDFRKRVSLARSPQGGVRLQRPTVLLDDFDASICRIAHRYRNDVYHAGRHNPALLEPLTSLYAQVVGRIFVRSVPTTLKGGGIADQRIAELDRFDWRDPDDSADVFVQSQAAARITQAITGSLEVDREELKLQLGRDLEERARGVERGLDELRAEGLPEFGVHELLKAAQLWAAHRGDEELIRLEEEKWRLASESVETERQDDEVRRAAFVENQAAQTARREELVQGFEFNLDLNTHQRLAQEGSKLRHARGSAAHLLERYQKLDEQLEVMERAVDWMVRSYDRLVQTEIDIARGK